MLTKLKYLQVGNKIFSRPRVHSIVGRAANSSCVIVTAPAGFGKTTAVSDYLTLQENRYRTIWLTMTDVLNHPGIFWQKVCQGLLEIGADVSDFRNTEDPDPDDMLRAFGNSVRSLGGAPRVALILDDFHLLTAAALIDNVEAIVLQRIPNLDVFVISRTPPAFAALPLAGGEGCAVVSQDDIRFTGDEARGWLESRKIRLSDDHLKDLMTITDGWISGLYLHTATISADGSALRFIPTDSDKLLEEEVLSRHDEQTQRLLLALSCLDEHPADLCTAVSGMTNAKGLMIRAAEDNMFVRSYKTEGDWVFSIHQIFLSFLRKKQMETSMTAYRDALRIAGDWYAASGECHRSAGCYMRGEHHERLIGVLEALYGDVADAGLNLNAFKREEFAQRGVYMESIPTDTLRQLAPMLELSYLPTLIAMGRQKTAMARVGSMFQYYAKSPRSAVRDRILGELELLRGFLSFNSLKAKDEAFTRAYDLIGGGSAIARPGVPVTMGSYSTLFLYFNEDRPLEDIVEAYDRHWKKFDVLLNGIMRGLGELFRGEMAYERGDFHAAKRFAGLALSLSAQRDVKLSAEFLSVRASAASGDVSDCIEGMRRIRSLAAQVDTAVLHSTLELCKFFLGIFLREPSLLPEWLTQGRLDESGNLVRGIGGSLETSLYHFWLLTNGSFETLRALLPDWKASCRATNSKMGLLYATISEAVLLHAGKDLAGAAAKLREAMEAAVPDGLVMPFVERSISLYPLVQDARRQRLILDLDAPFLRWLDDMDDVLKRHNRTLLNMRKRYAHLSGKTLSRRETEVRAFLEAGASRQEICDALDITPNNLKVIISRLNARLKPR